MAKQTLGQGDSNVVVRNQVVYGALPQDVIDRMGDTTLALQTTEQNVLPAINELKSNLIELSENTSITTTTLTGYSTLATYTISEEGNYAISTANGSASNNLIVIIAPNDSSNNVFYQFNYMSAPPYATVMTPIFHMKAGTYKIRATGSTSALWKYS